MADEVDIIKLQAAGFTPAQIAERLGMEEREVQGILDRIHPGVDVPALFRDVLQRWRSEGFIERYAIRQGKSGYDFILIRDGEQIELNEQQMVGYSMGVEVMQQHMEEKHHCASCDMHSCGDLELPALSEVSFEAFASAGLPKYLDKDGRAISKEEWERLSGDRVYVRIGATELRAGRDPEVRVVVSTLWTGVAGVSREVFETCVTRDGEVIDICRYLTPEAAKEGHNEMVGKHVFAAGIPGPKAVREIPAEET